MKEYPDRKCKVCGEDKNMYGGCRCNGYTTAFNKEPQTTDIQQLKAKISEFRESLEWYRDNVDRGYANGFLNRLDEIQKLSAVHQSL